MSLNNFIAQLWADTVLEAIQVNLVFGNLFNDDYEGKIAAYGDTVKINAIGDVTVSTYTKDTSIGAPQALTDAQTMLVVNQAKFYNFAVDDVDAAQAHPEVMSAAMRWAAYKVALTMDQFFAGFYTDAVAANLVGSSGVPTVPQAPTQANIGGGQTPYDYLLLLGQFLNQQGIPRQGRWCVVPPWITTYLLADIRFTSFNTPEARNTIKTGKLDASAGRASDAYLGQVNGMDTYESVNAPHIGGTIGITGSQDVVMAGHTMALTKAQGLTKTEAYRPPDKFEDAVKGLCLYGAKTVRPYGIAVAYLQHP